MMRELRRKWKRVCSEYEYCADCPVSPTVGNTNMCYIVAEGIKNYKIEGYKIEAFVKMVCAEYARLEGDAGDDAQDNNLSR